MDWGHSQAHLANIYLNASSFLLALPRNPALACSSIPSSPAFSLYYSFITPKLSLRSCDSQDTVNCFSKSRRLGCRWPCSPWRTRLEPTSAGIPAANHVSLALLLRPEQTGALNLLSDEAKCLKTMAYTQNSHEASRL